MDGPACSAYVHDSDAGLVTGLDTRGNRWQVWLNPHIAAGLLLGGSWPNTPASEQALARKRAELDAGVPAAAEAALAWAQAAGVRTTAERSRIAELLRMRAAFAEDLFGALLDEPDFPEAPLS